MTKDEALKLALKALEVVEPHTFPDSDAELFSRSAITACREALAQQQEPVAYGMWDTMLGKGNRMMMVRLDKGQDGCNVPLYTTPPQRTWVGLTDEERRSLREWQKIQEELGPVWAPMMLYLYDAIEAKLKEKNHG